MKVKDLILYLMDINPEALVLVEDRGEDGFGWEIDKENIMLANIRATDIKYFFATESVDPADKNNKLTCDAILF